MGRGALIAARLLRAAAVAALVAVLAACTAASGYRVRGVDPLAARYPAGTVVAFYGDSITAGYLAPTPEHRWTTLLCARHDWVEVNPSVPGLGFLTHRNESPDVVQRIIEAEPDLVVVAMGVNDLVTIGTFPELVRENIVRDVFDLRTALPDADIVVTLPMFPSAERPSGLRQIDAWLQTAADAAGVPLVADSARWLADQPTWTVDGIHPNDEGNLRLARLMSVALVEAFA